MARRCLYYPFIHFRDEGWLKLSALYWDDVSRIVPCSYQPRDSKEIRTLEDAGVLCRVDPGTYEASVSQLFRVLLSQHERKLVARYDVAQRDAWPANLDRFRVSTGRVSSRSLAFIHASKLEPTLVEQLLGLRLALQSRDRRWLGMHPNIVAAYMIALAGEIGRRRGLSPSSDNAMHLSGVTSCSADDLARALVAEVDLGKRRRQAPGARLESERVAFVTLRAVLPERLEGLSAKRIVELRRHHADARHAFHAYVDDLEKHLAASDISEPAALDEHIRLEYQKRLEPELRGLRRGLRSLGVGSVLGSCGVAVTLPIGSFLSVSTASAALAAAGATLGLAALAHKQRAAVRELVKPSPASFLFVTEGLGPRSLQKRLTESIRRFSLGA